MKAHKDERNKIHLNFFIRNEKYIICASKKNNTKSVVSWQKTILTGSMVSHDEQQNRTHVRYGVYRVINK